MSVPVPPGSGKEPDRSAGPVVVRYLFAAALAALLVTAAFFTQGGLLATRLAATPTAALLAAVQLTPAPAATVAPSPTAGARLAVESRPSGALVLVDGAEKGRTPLELDNLRAGSHRVQLSLSSEQLWEDQLSLAAGESRRLDISLPLPSPTPTPTPEPKGPVFPLAVMVENQADARPQSGLARADLVYEALVEGGITRFMAVFLDGESEVVGPVRSARHYFVYLAAELNAAYMHIGASPQGYGALNATGITTLDETYGDPGFWRSRRRYAPHNAYTGTDEARAIFEKNRDVTPGSTGGFTFRKEADPLKTGKEAQELFLVYPGGYRVAYGYSPETKSYPRYMEGLPHKDAETGEQVNPRNVVVQFVDTWAIPGDTSGRLDMEQVGQGKALFFQDGRVVEGFWHKPSYGNVTEWFDGDWKPMLMAPGKSWVQIIPPEGKVSY